MKEETEVVVVGGSYAGLSAAMSLGRALRHVIIIDSGRPCNRQTPRSHNFITHDGEKPSVIAEKAKVQVLAYPTVQFLEDEVTGVEGTDGAFQVRTSAGKNIVTRKIIFASGIRDRMPAIKGFADCWGISVLHCPYCHGYEVKKKPTAFMADGDFAMHFGLLLRQWTDGLMLFTNGVSALDQQQKTKLVSKGIDIVETKIEELRHTSGQLKSIVLADGSSHDFSVMYARIPFEQHSSAPAGLGCTLNEQGLIFTNEMKKTSVPGIFAAGDNTSPMRSVAGAVAAGSMAGAAVNAELAAENF